MLTRLDMTCIVCGNTKVAGLAGWHATCPACNYESAALSVAINAHSGPAVDEAEREVRVLERRCVDVGDAVAVAQHLHWRPEPGEGDLAARERQRLAQVDVAAGCGSSENEQKEP